MVYIAMRRMPKSREYRFFPYMEEVELMAPRSWGYLSYWEDESRGVGSLCRVCKVFSYRNVRGNHSRPRGIHQCAHLYVNVIRPLSMEMYPSA